MCGIGGVVSYISDNNEPIDRTKLLSISDSMTRRGPDDSGIVLEERVGLVHRRLAIIDLSPAGAQPMSAVEGRYIIVFNGEIYNYTELREFVLSRGYRLKSTSDTEVIPCLYDLEGEEMLRRLRGMFAFGIWDRKNRELLLARDPLGIKPLYYSDTGKCLWFASQVRALLAAGVDTGLDPAGHVGFHLWGSVPEPFTLYEKIRCLEAGHLLRVREGGSPRVHKYWSLTGALAEYRPGAMFDESESRLNLRELLEETVRRHLVADVPVGVFLSAGRDSTTLVALASEQRGVGMKTLTMSFDEFLGKPQDEAPLAKVVADKYGADHREVRYSNRQLRMMIEGFLQAMDQPTVDGFNVFMVSKAAQDNGLKVALSGVGADEVFGGYRSFQTIPRLAKRVRLTAFLPGLGRAFRTVSAPMIKSRTNPKYASVLELGSSLGGAYLLRRGMFMPWELPRILDGELVREGLRRLNPIAELIERGRALRSGPFVNLVNLETRYYLRNQLLRDSDWASMFHSLELRTPFVDATLLEAVVRHATRFGWPNKSVMANTPKEPLPREVLDRAKTGFGMPTLDPRRDHFVAGELPQRTWAREVYLTYLLNQRSARRTGSAAKPLAVPCAS